jgi:hypothetical protein
MAYCKDDALEILKEEAREEEREITRTLLAAVIHMQAAFCGKSKPEYTDYQWRALKLCKPAITVARAAGIEPSLGD